MRYNPDLIINDDDARQQAIDTLIAFGFDEPSLVIMSNVQLANNYHSLSEHSHDDTIQRITSKAVLATILTLRNRQTPTVYEHDNQLKHYRTPLVLQICGIGHPIMLVGPAGCGKTTIGEQTAKALKLPFYITSTINETHELTGFVDGYGKYHATPFRQAFETGGVWVADEIDAWDASALLTANSALANGFCTFPDQQTPVLRHADFRMIATANTFGTGADRVYVGRNELDAASLDRFAVIDVDYDLNLEKMFANGSDEWLQYVWDIRKAVDENKIRHVVSSRAISMGATALNCGIGWDDVKEIYLFKGMSEKDRSKLEDIPF